MYSIPVLDEKFSQLIKQKIDQKTKPLGALGQLELCAQQLVTIFSQQLQTIEQFERFTPLIQQPTLVVFAGDHGVAQQGVSIAPSEVTQQMVANFVSGGAAINVFCQQLGWQLEIVDAGILSPVESEKVHNNRLGKGTQPLNQCSAMSISDVDKGFDYARKTVELIHQQGCNLIAFGEMGIGNTTSAAAIMAALLSLPVHECVGKGTGVSEQVVAKKIKVIEQALTLHKEELSDAKSILARLGGFEIAQITGAILAAAELNMAVVIDGFICTAAAMLAIEINSNVKQYLIFAHRSNEQGHNKMLSSIAVQPLLNLDLRLGEGTGAALSLPLLQASLAFYNNMASFADAKVEQVV